MSRLTGMFIGSYTPQVVTIMGLTGLSYSKYMIAEAGSFEALVALLQPLLESQSKVRSCYCS